jgi:hypothetical protein
MICVCVCVCVCVGVGLLRMIAAQPFCTIQAAVAVVNPGQTVYVERGSYGGEVDITRSGTASAPITITSAPLGTLGPVASIGASNAVAHVIALTGVQYVNVSNLAVGDAASDSVLISGSSHVTLDNMWLQPPGPVSAPLSARAIGVHVTAASTAVTVERVRLINSPSTGIEVDGG